MNPPKSIYAFLLYLVLFFGCAGGEGYKRKLAAVRPNMSKDELMLIMKEPGEVKASAVGKDGKLTELWEYTITVDMVEGETVRFYFHFVDDRLVKWGKR